VLIDTAWAFRLDPIERRRTRLLARTRILVESSWGTLALKWLGAGDTVVQRRLLEGIKTRVETTPAGSEPKRSQRAASLETARPPAPSLSSSFREAS
jgi:hypothetical protein